MDNSLQSLVGDPALMIHSGSFFLGVLAAWILGLVGYAIRSMEDKKP